MPMVKRMDSRLYDFILGTLHRGDEMHINYAYRQLLEHHDWHDGSSERGKAPFDMPSSTREAITTAAATEEQFLSNAHSRIKRQVQREIQRQIEDASTRAQCTEAKFQYARFVSAGGKMASRWLDLPPRESRLSKVPLFFPSHLFRIALQYRSGLQCVPDQVVGTQCKCKCMKNGRRHVWDKYGRHLAACPWGGGRINRHDRVNTEVGMGLREAGNAATWLRTDRLQKALPTHAATRGTSRVRVQRFADIAVTDQNDKDSLIDTKITRTTHSKEPLHAATAGEKQKQASYEEFLDKCREEDPTDARLNQTITPVVFETYGAAGKLTRSLMDLTRHQYSNNILQCEDKSSEQIFYSTWSQRIATALQIGNATMIHNIPRGISVKSRATGDRITDDPTPSPTHPIAGVRGAPYAVDGADSESESDCDSATGPEPDTPS